MFNNINILDKTNLLDDLKTLVGKNKNKINGIAIVKISAEWCGPCNKLGYLLNDYAKYNNSVSIFVIDIDKVKDFADRLGIKVIPYLLFYKNGQLVYFISAESDMSINKIDEIIKLIK